MASGKARTTQPDPANERSATDEATRRLNQRFMRPGILRNRLSASTASVDTGAMGRASAGESGAIRGTCGRDCVGGSAPAIVARQGIYDAHLHLVAYELLFRPTSDADVQISDADAATAQVLLTAFSDVGLDKLVGHHRAFVNVPYAFLTDGFCQTLPTDRVVLEILEDVEIDCQVIKTARALVRAGHTLALDDFMFRPGVEALVELATIVKLDILALTPAELDDHVKRLRGYGVMLLAEKVEAADQIPALLDMGFEYFQGFALQRPTTVRARSTGANKTVLVQILARMHDPGITPADLVETVGRDPSIAYALLRILNSAHLSLPTKVTSLRQALVLIGIDGLRSWTTMMIMSRLAPDSHEVLTHTLVRAKMCELCTSHSVGADPAAAFTAGLLSTLPTILERSIDEVVEELGLAAELRAALLDHRGSIGEILSWVLAYDSHNPNQLAEVGAPHEIATVFIEAMQWSNQLTSALEATH